MMDWRNPFEDFRDKYLSFTDVRSYKLWVWRYNYIPFSTDRILEYEAKIREVWGKEIPQVDLEQFMPAWQTYKYLMVIKGKQPWITKYFNAKFSIHLGVSYPINHPWLKLPFIGIVYRWDEQNYFQFGLGFGPEGLHQNGTDIWERSTICGKFRFANFKDEYYKGGNFDVYGYYEGIC